MDYQGLHTYGCIRTLSDNQYGHAGPCEGEKGGSYKPWRCRRLVGIEPREDVVSTSYPPFVFFLHSNFCLLCDPGVVVALIEILSLIGITVS